MAGEQHGVNKGHFKVGAVVKCLDNLGHELQGEVVAVDGPSGTAYLSNDGCSHLLFSSVVAKTFVFMTQGHHV